MRSYAPDATRTARPGRSGSPIPTTCGPILEAAGWRDVELDDVQVPFRAGADADDAYAFVAGTGIVRGLVQDLDADQRRAGFDALRATVDAHDTGTDAGVVFDSAAWIIHAVRAR